MEPAGASAAFAALCSQHFGVVAVATPWQTVTCADGQGVTGMLSHIMSGSNITPPLTELMVLGVGVDYALFIVTRHRRNLRRGMSVRDSIVAAINTSGRAVLFAGTTVCIAMLGLTALGV